MSNQNFFVANTFEFTLNRAPTLEFYVQSVNVPDISITPAIQQTPFMPVKRGGDEMQHGDLTVNFRIDNELKSFREIYNWIEGISNPENFDTRTALESSQDGIYSDAALIVYNKKDIPFIKFNFRKIFPISISGLSLNTTDSGPNYPEMSVTFSHDGFDFEIIA